MLESIRCRAKMLLLFALFFLPVVAEWYSKKVDDQWRVILTPTTPNAPPQQSAMANDDGVF
jgi:hypothetical protein